MSFRSISFILCTACLGAALARAQQADPVKVAQVAAGTLTEARVSWWGFDPADSTAFLQQAINSKVPKLIVDKMPSPWITNKLTAVSNQEIIFEEGVELVAMKGQFQGVTDALMTIRLQENVTLRGLGKGATLRMHKADYHTDAYQKSEWRHGISILSSRQVSIINLSIVDSGGDGIYLGIGKRGEPDTDILIKNVVCDGNNRQGISVIAAVNMLIEDTRLINTSGTAPEAGIDFEPNLPDEPIRNCVMRNCFSENNNGGGYVFYLPNMESAIGPLEVTLENCISKNEKRAPLAFYTGNGPGRTMQGHFKVVNCTFENAAHPISLVGNDADGVKIEFVDVTIDNCGHAIPKSAIIGMSNRAEDEATGGNLFFRNVTVKDPNEDRPLFHFSDSSMGGGGLRNIGGEITFIANGKTTKHVFSDEWAKAAFPPREIKKIPYYPMDGARFQPYQANAAIPDQDLPDLQPRGLGRFWLHANQGEEIRLAVLYGQLGNYSGTAAPVSLTTPSGKKLALGSARFKEVTDLALAEAPETGLYQVEISAGGNWSAIKRSNRAIVLPAYPKAAHLASGGGDYFVLVPPGSGEFGIRLWGEGAEGLKATIFDPAGNQVWQKDDISAVEQFVGTQEQGQAGGVWKLRVEKPTNLPVIEDHFIRIYGIPPFIGLAPELLLAPTP